MHRNIKSLYLLIPLALLFTGCSLLQGESTQQTAIPPTVQTISEATEDHTYRVGQVRAASMPDFSVGDGPLYPVSEIHYRHLDSDPAATMGALAAELPSTAAIRIGLAQRVWKSDPPQTLDTGQPLSWVALQPDNDDTLTAAWQEVRTIQPPGGERNTLTLILYTRGALSFASSPTLTDSLASLGATLLGAGTDREAVWLSALLVETGAGSTDNPQWTLYLFSPPPGSEDQQAGYCCQWLACGGASGVCGTWRQIRGCEGVCDGQN